MYALGMDFIWHLFGVFLCHTLNSRKWHLTKLLIHWYNMCVLNKMYSLIKGIFQLFLDYYIVLLPFSLSYRFCKNLKKEIANTLPNFGADLMTQILNIAVLYQVSFIISWKCNKNTLMYIHQYNTNQIHMHV